MNEPSLTLQKLMESKNRATAAGRQVAEPPYDVQDERFFGHLRGLQDAGKAIEIRRRDSSWPALRYVYLKYSEWFHAGEFRLHYVTGETVIVKGRNLRSVYDHLLMEKLTYLREAGDGEKAQELELFVDELILIPSADKENMVDEGVRT